MRGLACLAEGAEKKKQVGCGDVSLSRPVQPCRRGRRKQCIDRVGLAARPLPCSTVRRYLNREKGFNLTSSMRQ